MAKTKIQMIARDSARIPSSDYSDNANELKVVQPAFERVYISQSLSTAVANSLCIYSGWDGTMKGETIVVPDEVTSYYQQRVHGRRSAYTGNGRLQTSADVTLVTGDNEILGYYNKKYNILWVRNYAIYRSSMAFLKDYLLDFCGKIGLIKKADEEFISSVVPITLGSDPEFVFWDNGSVVHARETLNTYHFLDDESAQRAEIGCDGHEAVGELRPMAGKSGKELTENIQYLLEDMCTIPWQVDCVGVDKAIGCHIHYGHKDLASSERARELSKVIDHFLGRELINLSGEGRGSYKELTAYETKPYGFEYRSFPGTIMTDKKFFSIVADTCHKIATDYVSGKEFFIDTSRKAGKKELLEYMTDEDYNYYTEWASAPVESRVGKLYKYWGIEEKRLDMPRRMTFRDEYDESVKKFIQGHKLSMTQRTYIGLAKSRGDYVISLPLAVTNIEGYQNTQIGSGIGLPYILRTDPSMIPILASLLDAIYDAMER